VSMTGRVETVSIDHGIVFRKSEESRFGVSGLSHHTKVWRCQIEIPGSEQES
jgi:hypothetical protein